MHKNSPHMRSQQSLTIGYDGIDEDDMTFLHGIGCGETIQMFLKAAPRGLARASS